MHEDERRLALFEPGRRVNAFLDPAFHQRIDEWRPVVLEPDQRDYALLGQHPCFECNEEKTSRLLIDY